MTDYVYGLVGGVLLGLAAVFLRISIGAPLGVSGFLSKALLFRFKVADWRLSFLVGMLVVAVVLRWTYPEAIGESLGGDLWRIALAATLVGSGARIAGGCTSGHSLCGMGSLDIDSIAATLIFIVAGAATVYLTSGGVVG
ncbi:YeeE/YedE family protein [Verrucomicrobiia bacterium DG1235]|nr:YeeE/YedE family protein [Verrucomicrobiae bacterium DG1235]